MKYSNITTYKFRIILSLFVMIAAGVALQSCHDDTFDDFNVHYPEGETDVCIDLNFEPIASNALHSRGGAPAGDVIKELRDLSILFYDPRSEGNQLVIARHFTAEDIKNRNGLTVEWQDRTDNDASNGVTAESRTQHVTTKIEKVPYAAYKIYAVANLVGGTKAVLEGTDISTPDKLLGIKALWDEDAMTNNAQMLGHFTVGKQQPSPGTGEAAPDVPIIHPNQTVHAWLRRLASKITIDYDPSMLRKGITVTIKKVTVRDIPSTCFLGGPNTMGPADAEGRINTDALLNNDKNHSIVYDDPIVLTNAVTDYPRKAGDPDYPHTETAPALFFFENMQGEVPDKDKNGKLQDGKLQDSDGDGEIDHPDGYKPESEDYKDGLRYGTYIEVEAEYDAKTLGHIGRGAIKYRFMIGKNVTTNCDAERNHHYKLTLRFLGNANEVDWHIEYDEKPGFYGPNPYFVSYSYNRMTTYPIKIAGEIEGDVTMTIIQNAWWPNNAKDITYFAKTPGLRHITDDGKVVNDSVGVDFKKLYGPEPSNAPAYEKTHLWSGFLSLAQDMDNPEVSLAYGVGVVTGADTDPNKTFLYDYWRGVDTNVGGYSYKGMVRGKRTYKTTPGTHSSASEGGAYTVTKDDNATIINVPFYTREKQLQSTTAYTGNNPFTSYWREAKVLLEYKLKGEANARKDTIKVYQVRRIVNPKGVWRKHNNQTPFDVTLMIQPNETSATFEPLKSIGPWRAYVSRGNAGFIKLDGRNEVRGGDGTEVKFRISFNGTIHADQNRCAVIRVEYNNYSSHHLIFVRQGEAPIQMNYTVPIKWHLANVVSYDGTEATEGSSPLDEGSMFRYGNLSKGIMSLSNPPYAKEIAGGAELQPEDFNNGDGQADPSFERLSDGTLKGKWSSMKDDSNGFSDVIVKGKTCRVATIDDIATLIPGIKTSCWGTTITGNDVMESGYGVLYGDESTETATTIEKAYGYFIHPTDPQKSKTDGYGMRGMFVYNASTSTATLGGNNIFFPIGRSGFGRRKSKSEWNNKHSIEGVMQYAARSEWYEKNNTIDAGRVQYLPLFDDLFRSHGALYWVKKRYVTSKETVRTMDINYHTLDFGYADLGENGTCFVRMVEE